MDSRLFVFRYVKLLVGISRGLDKLQHWPPIVYGTGYLRRVFAPCEGEEKKMLQHLNLLYMGNLYLDNIIYKEIYKIYIDNKNSFFIYHKYKDL